MAAAAASAAAACGPGAAPGAPGDAAGKAPVTLRLSFPAGVAEHTMAVRGPVFQKHFPHVTLQLEPAAEYPATLAAQVAGNAIGDLLFLESGGEAFYARWAANGVLTKLDPLVERDKYDTSVFLPQAVQALRAVDGKIWGFPYLAYMACCGLFYNRALFDKAGLRPPTDAWTYDAIAEHAQRLTTRTGPNNATVDVWGGGRKLGSDLAVAAVTRAFGGDLYAPDGKHTLIASRPSQEALTWWLDRSLKDRSVTNDLMVKNPRGLLEQGKLAFAMGYTPGDRVAVARALNAAGVPWGLALMPRGPAGRRGGVFVNAPLGMAKITRHQNEAWELQKFLADKETGVIMGLPEAGSGQHVSHFGARRDVYTDARVLKAPDMPPGVMAALARSMELPEPFWYPRNFRGTEVSQVLNTELRRALTGEVPYDEGFFDTLAQQVQAVLDLPGT
jgi:multiple sugar transport system substrate-binding protein